MTPTNPSPVQGQPLQTPTGTVPGYNGVLSPAMALATVWDIDLVNPKLANREQYDAMYWWNQPPAAWPLGVVKGAPYQNGSAMTQSDREAFCDDLIAKGYEIDETIYYDGNVSPMIEMLDRFARGILGTPPGLGSKEPIDGTIPAPAYALPIPANYIPTSLVMPSMPAFPAPVTPPVVVPSGVQPIGAYNPVFGAGVAPHYIGGFFNLGAGVKSTDYPDGFEFTPPAAITVAGISIPLTGTWAKGEVFMGMVAGWTKTA